MIGECGQISQERDETHKVDRYGRVQRWKLSDLQEAINSIAAPEEEGELEQRNGDVHKERTAMVERWWFLKVEADSSQDNPSA